MARKMVISELFAKHLGQHVGDAMMAKINEMARAKKGGEEIYMAIVADLDVVYAKVKGEVKAHCERVSQAICDRVSQPSTPET